MKVYLIGVGPGDERYLTDYARDLILDAKMVLTTPELLEQFWHLNPNTVCKPAGELADAVVEIYEGVSNLCVLVDGDVGFFSESQALTAHLQAEEIPFECVNGLNRVQYFAAVLNVAYEDAVLLRVQHTDEPVTPLVCYNPKIFVLTGANVKAHEILNELCAAGLENVSINIGENLGAENELLTSGTPRSLQQHTFANHTVMLVRNVNFVDAADVLADVDFIGGAAPMTKQAVRRLSLAELKIKPADVLADICAGNGALSVEAARRANRGRVLAFEKNREAAKLVRQNIGKFGAYNVTVKEADFLQSLSALPHVDKAFIGAAAANISEIVAGLLANNPLIRIVINAVSLEAVNTALQALKGHRLAPEIMLVNVALAEPSGAAHVLKAQNPVYIISAQAS